jgi:peptidoglycan/LPS O-acetylase OafA/YrhL
VKPAQRLDALTGVRFIAAAAVVVHHLKDPLAKLIASHEARAAISWGHLAVPFFFILSGFILMHAYPDYQLKDHGRFVWLRFARLWPVHVVTLAALVLYVGCLAVVRGYVPDAKYDFAVILPELLMVRHWFVTALAWNAPAWSIHAEWLAYIFVFPLCAVYVRRLTQPWLIGGLIVLALAVQPHAKSVIMGQAGNIAPLFIAGALAYQLRTLIPVLPAAATLVNGTLLLALPAMWWYNVPVCFLAFTAIIFGLSYQQGAVARFLSTRAMVHGGTISFSLYMVHNVVIVWAADLWKALGVAGWLPVSITFAASILAAHLLWKWVEAPANDWLRGKRTKMAVRAITA